MKRWFCLFLALLLICPCLLLGVSAAEPTEYIFEVMPSVSMLDDYEFIEGSFASASGDFQLPSGRYNLYFSYGDYLLSSVDPVLINYDLQTYAYPRADFSVSFDYLDTLYSFSFQVMDFFSNGGSSILVTGNYFPEGGIFKFVPVDDEIVSLTDLISSVRIDSILNEIICLLPVAVCCVVLFLGIRKGIAFLFNFLNGA